MGVVNLLLLILAAVSFGIATSNIPTKFNPIALGLLLWIMVPLITAIQTLD